MGGIASSAKNFVKSPTRVGTALVTMGASEAWRKTNPGLAKLQQMGDNYLGGNGEPGQPAMGPFGFDATQDKADILAEGQRQYKDTLAGLDALKASSAQDAAKGFAAMLPDIAENSQAAHLYDSTGYGNEVARQEADIVRKLTQDDVQRRYDALGGLQGFQTGALQRGQSLQDFANQANVAKAIGAQSIPAAPNAKQNFASVAQGAGALAPWARVLGPATAATAVRG